MGGYDISIRMESWSRWGHIFLHHNSAIRISETEVKEVTWFFQCRIAPQFFFKWISIYWMLTGAHAKYFTCDFLSPGHPVKWLLLLSSIVTVRKPRLREVKLLAASECWSVTKCLLAQLAPISTKTVSQDHVVWEWMFWQRTCVSFFWGGTPSYSSALLYPEGVSGPQETYGTLC